MNILFFCHEDFACNSMGHIAGFAAGLRALGHVCAAAIPGDDRASAAKLGDQPPFHPVIFADTWERVGELFPDGRPADILHAWTPREHVRRAVEHCRRGIPAARLVVHLEDNEEHLTACFLGEEQARLRDVPAAELAARLPVHLSHPREYPRFLGTADGVTGIVAALADFVPRGVPFTELRPGVDFARFHPGPPDPALRESLGLRPDEKVLCYPGSSHFANGAEMASLYEAVFLLNRRGTPCRLIRTGWDTPGFNQRFAPRELLEHVLHLGFVDRARLPGLLRLADALVQPGADDAFNHYRLPSKLPEFLASGRPVLLPRANVGQRVRPDREALILETGGAEEIAAGCERVFTDAALARRLGEGGAAFARRSFDPAVNARGLARFYQTLRSPWRRIKAFCTTAILVCALGCLRSNAQQMSKVYIGGGDEHKGAFDGFLSDPNGWSGVRQNADGSYINTFPLRNNPNDAVQNHRLSTMTSLFSNRNVFYETEAGSYGHRIFDADDEARINILQKNGFRLSFVTCNGDFTPTRATILQTWSGTRPLYALMGPWAVGGDINSTNP